MGSDYYMNPPRVHTYHEARVWAWTPKKIYLYRITDSDYGPERNVEHVADFQNEPEIRRLLGILGVDIVNES